MEAKTIARPAKFVATTIDELDGRNRLPASTGGNPVGFALGLPRRTPKSGKLLPQQGEEQLNSTLGRLSLRLGFGNPALQ